MHKIILLLGCAALSGMAEAEVLSLDQALVLAKQNSPSLRAAQIHAQAAGKAVAATGFWKNPQLEFEAERVGGDRDGVDGAQGVGGHQRRQSLGVPRHAGVARREVEGDDVEFDPLRPIFEAIEFRCSHLRSQISNLRKD